MRNWQKSRELLSRGGNTYARLMLGIGLKDATGGYRAYRATTLRAIALDEVESQGYCFQIDLAMRDTGRAARGGGADHVRRTGPRQVQDEPGHRRGSTVAGHHLGAYGRGRRFRPQTGGGIREIVPPD